MLVTADEEVSHCIKCSVPCGFATDIGCVIVYSSIWSYDHTSALHAQLALGMA
jgi:hypothetical protein